MKKLSSQRSILLILSVSQLLGLSLWFATNAVLDQLKPEFNLNDSDLTLLSISVTMGFVLGGLTSSLFNLSDLMRATKLFFFSSLLGGIANLLIAVLNGPNFTFILLMRFMTGVFLAGIYPVGMKITASHFKTNRGLAVGVLLSALTAGSGLPYLFRLFGTPDWQFLISLVAVLSIFGGLMVFLLIEDGPYVGKGKKFRLKAVRIIYSKKSVRLANYGYFGHMWELYAMWVWIPVMLRASYSHATPGASDSDIIRFVSVGTFLVFLGGAVANIIGGFVSDRIGRTAFNIVMLSVSGLSGLTIGIFYDQPIAVLMVAIIWGITIVPDSPQYSTMITEVSDQSLVGSALTIQTAMGFALTIISIQLIFELQQVLSWRYVFMILSIGPMLGIVSMIKLRKEPDAVLICQGKK